MSTSFSSVAALQTESQESRPIDPRSLEANEIRELRGKHLTVYTDVRDRPDVDQLPEVFDAAVPQWCELFNLNPAKLETWHLKASVMVDPQRFARAGLFPDDLPSFLAGYQRGDAMWAYVQSGDYYTRHLVLHEGTHAVMDQFLGGLGAPWYAEGMAELIGLNQLSDQKLRIGYGPRSRDEVPYWGRVGILQKAVASGEKRTLHDVLAIPAPAFRQVESYAWAWAACEFLTYHPISSDAFAALLQHCNETPNDFNRRLTEPLAEKWDELEFAWQIFLSEMEYGYDVERAALTDVQAAQGDPKELEVAADRGWQVTPITVTKGKPISITASGEFQIAFDTEPWPCQANGVTIEYYRGRPWGRLVAAILPVAGDSVDYPRELEVIDVGHSATITPSATGQLLLRINDSPARWRDNTGSLKVWID